MIVLNQQFYMLGGQVPSLYIVIDQNFVNVVTTMLNNMTDCTCKFKARQQLNLMYI